MPKNIPQELRRRNNDLVKPSGMTDVEWIIRLEIEKADLNRQIRREVHTRSFVHGKYCERLDRAISFARAAIAAAKAEPANV